MKKILISLSIIGAVAAIAVGVTFALFNDTETSTGNIFTAGTLDLKVDHKFASYNGSPCTENCVEDQTNLIQNGGFETPDVPTGGWAIYTNANEPQTHWTIESGSGLEIQDNAAGAPHGGNQLAELDSYNSSVISQIITTVAGGKYRLTFWYSPRPNRPAGDNTIGAIVKVVSNNAILVNATIGAGSAGGSTTNWQKFTYDFVAVDASTKVMFSDLGTSNSYGGYLDDIGVRVLNCSNSFPSGGTCTLWDLKDLGPSDYYWHYGPDMKPGDYGTNIIRLHAYSNDAYACLIDHNIKDYENVCIDPENAVSDPSCGAGDHDGELSGFLKAFVWVDDSLQNNAYDNGETILYGPGPFTDINTMVRIPLTASNTKYIGIAWCFGTQTYDASGVHCSGSGNQDIAQTDSFLSSFTAYAEQQRNNEAFDCASVKLVP